MNPEAIIREYREADKEAVISLLRLNTPRYFAPEEEQHLHDYLEREREYYFVIEWNGEVIGSGGINFAGDPETGRISWDILHPGHHHKGFGTQLLLYRIAKLKTFEGLRRIIVRTSQVAYLFYEKNGFVLVEIAEDYWAPGFDLYLMEYQPGK